jgi:peptidoglycan/LPS O-acetylase OafA/YrhL
VSSGGQSVSEVTLLPAIAPPLEPPRDAKQDDEETGSGFQLGRRPELTGIRALLIACVLVYHSSFRLLPGAWAALGSFFVLSGFLITTMLAREHEATGSIKLGVFYGHRAVRLLPPLFLTVVGIALYAALVHVFDAANKIWGDAAAALFYFADYRSALGHESSFGFLAQCWSLAVEEQFYLVWAILFFVALKYGSRKAAYGIAFLGVGASVADRLWLTLTAHPWTTQASGRIYYAFDTRADALFLGCLLGLLATGGHLDNWKPTLLKTLNGAALVATGFMIWILWNVQVTARSLPLLWLPMSEVCSLVIITCLLLNRRGLGARLLGIPILVLLGNMSYAIYLLHWPVFVALSPFTVKWPFWVMETVRLVIIISLAVASWYLVERPLMKWRRRAVATDGGSARTADLAELRRLPGPQTGIRAADELGAQPSAVELLRQEPPFFQTNALQGGRGIQLQTLMTLDRLVRHQHTSESLSAVEILRRRELIDR